jgi:hypothetical protein
LIGFILSERIENMTIQLVSLYDIQSLLTRPLFLTLIILTLGVLSWGLFKKSQLDYV